MKLYSTTDIAASVKKAYEQFTHVILNRGYTILKPVYFKTATLDGLPVLQYASWIPASETQLARWKNLGGILIEQDTRPKDGYQTDVTVMVEAPYDMDRLKACNWRNNEYGVIPNPMSWSTHEECIDLRFPTADLLREIWTIANGQPFTNSELATETGIPISQLQYIKNALHPVEHWYVQKRLAPEREEMLPAYDWLESGMLTKNAIIESGHKSMIEELGKFGYIDLKRRMHYPAQEPDWQVVERKRQRALSDLAAVRSLVESLPDHLSL
jgi:hypothetical protein